MEPSRLKPILHEVSLENPDDIVSSKYINPFPICCAITKNNCKCNRKTNIKFGEYHICTGHLKTLKCYGKLLLYNGKDYIDLQVLKWLNDLKARGGKGPARARYQKKMKVRNAIDTLSEYYDVPQQYIEEWLSSVDKSKTEAIVRNS